ncbi:4-hydroxy-3-methylbut-2-enyl diphosphate reductase [Williamsia sp. CHRR-6]|uniref:4-hydroxy-3-methylbut-2-enyl diphosphate reductase n=1 Tax=Williamsia sp. CHRR-6 TaxID=2835871 RepID=UPI001BD925E9|nr:4-hydroxy-3-methylbut-2-enyl diphosphate reductase [Williamsia sp. CHRR-6]MBT0567603.1 4-hydroxy-3-methylbut-2-enyl diphosphate reductase [Williamsia sp. CHRR-6]
MAPDRTVLVAAPRAFCAGVERAIDIVERVLATHPHPVYVRKQIVHNAHVVADLSARGAIFVEDLDEVPAGATVVFSAHGVSPAVRAEADRRDMTVFDATCPLVAKVHTEVQRFAARGDTILFIGEAGHDETEATLGEAPEQTMLVQTVDDARTVQVPDPTRVAYLTQTTLAHDETAEIIAALSRRFPALRGPGSDDICYASTNRQAALREIAETSDLVLVVGSINSANTARLVDIARRMGTTAHLIEDVGAIDERWLIGAMTIGVTAGASAPPALVDEVIDNLRRRGNVVVREVVVARETLTFDVPAGLRRLSVS